MAYSALQLINRAYYLSQVVARELQTPKQNQIADGLYLLNALLDFKGTDTRLIPYYQRTTFTGVIGQEAYVLPNLLLVDTLTFNIGQIRYPMTDMTRDMYFGTARVDNIQSLPFSYRVERGLGGCTIYLYYVPNAAYIFNLSGKYGLTDVSLFTDMASVYDTYYIEYLRYGLAEYICSEFGATFPDECKMQLARIEKKLLDVEPADLSATYSNYFDKGYGIDWQTANLSTGYWPF